MPYADLKYRRRMSTSVDNGLMDGFDNLADSIEKPKSWLVDEAIEDLLKKYNIPYTKTSRKNRP